MKKNELDLNPDSKVGAKDWALIRESRPEDYDGSTRFDRMTPHARLVWLDMSVDFVSRMVKRTEPSKS